MTIPAGGDASSITRSAVEAVLDVVPVPMVIVVAPQATIGFANRALSDLIGVAAEELVGRSVRDFLEPEAVERVRDELLALITGEVDHWSGRVSISGSVGRSFPCDVSIGRVRLSGASGESADTSPADGAADEVFIGAFSDITEVVATTDQLRVEATTDPLTGVCNRRGMELFEPPASTVWLAACYLDLDGFKGVNDTHGHDVGDELLRHVADRLRASTRPGDCVARLGGDEFVVLCPVGSPDRSDEIARRLDRALAEPVIISVGPVVVAATVGVATTRVPAPLAELVRAADAAMYATRAAVRSHDLTVTDDDR
jgi:diguanylate cyclase (GGDEF)-like protein/PAS domain S-box-containing protein